MIALLLRPEKPHRPPIPLEQSYYVQRQDVKLENLYLVLKECSTPFSSSP